LSALQIFDKIAARVESDWGEQRLEMGALKHIAEILLAAVGAAFALGAVVAGFEPGSGTPFWAVAVLFIFFGLAPLVGAWFLLRTSIMAPIKMCPQCGDAKRLPSVAFRKSRSRALIHLGGLLAALWGASRESQFRCAQCNTLYLADTRSARVARVVFWVFLPLVVLGVVTGELEGN
jgi:hypothetical protein